MLCNYRFKLEEFPKVCFPYLNMRISGSEEHFPQKYGENVAWYLGKKKQCQGFFMLLSKAIHDYFSEENGWFINFQSFTACPKQIRPVTKITWDHFLEKGLKKT